jgi:hypothetical protein
MGSTEKGEEMLSSDNTSHGRAEPQNCGSVPYGGMMTCPYIEPRGLSPQLSQAARTRLPNERKRIRRASFVVG